MFGDFTLKSGRKSPYFFNTGSLCTGDQLYKMGKLYADLLKSISDFNEATVIFGSAYKGIPLSVATAIALQGSDRASLRAVSDRKEVKTHGDNSAFIGLISNGDKAVIVDDVISNGLTKMEAIEKLKVVGCSTLGIIIAFDRCEPIDSTGKTAKQNLEELIGVKVYSLMNVFDLMKFKPEVSDLIEEHLNNFKF